MNAISACQNAQSSAPRVSSHRHITNKVLFPVLALFVFLCGTGPIVHAQSAYYAGVTTPFGTTTGFTSAEGIAADASGNLFVAATDGVAWNVYEMTAKAGGGYNAPVALPAPTGGYACTTTPCLRNVAVDSNRNVWVADFGGHVYETTYSAGAYTVTTDIPGPAPSGWVSPWGVTADSSGNVFVSDYGANSIAQITAGTAVWINTTSVSQPGGIAVSSSGNLFVLDGNVARVVELAPPYTSATTVSNTQFGGLGNLTLDNSTSTLWVTNYNSNLIVELAFDPDTSTYTTAQMWGSGLNGPVGILPLTADTVLVTNENDGSIHQVAAQQHTFASAAVGSSSASQSITFTFTASTTLTAPPIVVSGSGTATNQDYTDAGTGSCPAGTYAAFSTCTVDVKFTPKSPGSRPGAVILTDSLGNVAQAFLYGTATGPQLTFNPGTGTTKLAATFTTPQKVAVDASGNVFVVDSGASTITEILAGGGTQPIAPVGLSLSTPYSIAIDGAGNLFVGESGNGRIDEIFAPSYSTYRLLPGGFTPLGLAFDQNGNLFVADATAVREVTAASGYGSTLTLNTSLGKPFGVAVDTAGNIWVADAGNGTVGPSVTELSSSGSTIRTLSSYSGPEGIAVDPANNVYIADTTGGTVTELTADSNYATSITLATTANDPAAVALDNSGNVYYTTNASDNSVYKIDLADPPSLTFAISTPYNTLSTEEQSVTLSNTGNAALNLSAINFSTASFLVAADSGCTATSSLTSAQNSCLMKFGFQPQAVGANTGTATVTDNAGTGSQIITLNGTGTQATPTLSVTNSPVVYNGAAQAATVTGSVAGTVSNVRYSGSATVPTAAGTYTITANFTPTDTTHYASLTGASAGNFVINKATPVLSITNSPQPYTGSPIAAALQVTATGISGTISGNISSVLYNGSATVPTAAGSYPVTATFTPTDTADFNTVTAGSAGTFVIGKINPTLSITNSPVTYNGTPQAATLSSGGVAGNFTAVQYNGSATVPTAAGTYAVTATFTPTDGTDYNTLTGASVGSFVINKATLTLSITNSPATYTGAAQSAIIVATAAGITGNVAGTPSAIRYNGSATAPTAAGSYAVTANFTPTDGTDFSVVTAGSAGNFVIGKATPTLSVTNSPVVYSGSPQAATVTGSVPGTVSAVLYGGSGTVPTAAGTYAITASFTPTDTADYNSLTAASAGNFVIGKATPTLSVTNSPVTYNGSAHAATVTGSVAGTVSNILYNGSATAPTAAGTYAITADFTPTDATDYATLTAASAGSFVISKATPTLSVTNSPAVYTGAAQSAAVTGSVPGTVSAVLYNGSATVPIAAGTYAVTANFTPTDTTNYASLTAAAAGNFVIGKATPTLSVTNSPVTYTGAAQAAAVAGSVPGTVSAVLYNGSATVPISAGSYAITASFVPTDTNDYNSLTATAAGTFVIGKATPTLSVTNSPVTYNGATHAAAVASSVPGTVSAVLYSGSATVPSAAGTYAMTANFTPTDTTDYITLTAASAGNFVIAKATPTLSVTNSPVAYTGNPQAASVTGSVPGTVSAILYNGSATVPTAAGTYAITASFTPTDSTDYATLTAASAGNFVIGTIAPTITFVVPNHTFGDAPFAVAATSNSTGALTYSVVSGPASIAGATVTLTGAGTVVLKASQVAAGNYTAGSQNATFLVGMATPTITWTSPGTIVYGTPLSATQLNATASIAGTFTYTPAAGTILPVGAGQTLSVSFAPTDSVDYKPATATTTISVTATGLTVSANNATRTYGTANPTFTGTITGAQNGDTFTESFTTTATVTSNAGTYAIVPSASGPNLANYTVVINNGTLTITKANTTTSLSASGSSVNPGATVTLTATVASTTSGTPTGSVSFYDGTTLLGTGTLSGGVATYATTTLAAGTSHTITAVYSGDANFNTSSTTTSTGITVGVLDFTLGTPTPATQTGSAGTTFTYAFNISPLYGSYADTVNFTATGLPAGASATFSPASIPANGGPQSVTMIVTTAAGSAALVKPSMPGRGLIPVALAFLFLPLAGTKRMRREGRRLGRFAGLLLLVLAGLGATAALTGCGSHSGFSNNGQSYTITITAATGSIQHTSTVTLDLK